MIDRPPHPGPRRSTSSQRKPKHDRTHSDAFATMALIVGSCGSRRCWPRRPGRPSRQDIFAADQVLWEVELGDHQYTVPRVEGDRIYIGVNDTNLDHPAARSTGGGILMCLDRATGQLDLAAADSALHARHDPPFHFDHWKCGICSRPAVDGNRLYVVGPRGDVLCVDRAGTGERKRRPVRR